MTLKNIFFFLVLLLLPLAAAADGCFLYADSPSFCQEISKEQAQEECDFFNRCEIKKVFFEHQFCNAQKQCQKVLCKSNCQQESFGQCAAGPATDPQWCTPGCCQFEYFGNNFCSYLPSKNRCAREVQNRDVTLYRFSTKFEQQSCAEFCATGKTIFVEEETIELVPEKTITNDTPSPISPPPSTSQSPLSTPPHSQSPKSPELSLSFFLLLFFITLVLAFVFFLFWKHAHRRRQTLAYKIPESELAERKKLAWFFPFASRSQVKERIEKVKKFHKHKLEHHHREEFLVASGLAPEKEKTEKPKEDAFRKLQKLVKKAPEEKSPLQMLEEMGKK